jgi:hypothetical protein
MVLVTNSVLSNFAEDYLAAGLAFISDHRRRVRGAGRVSTPIWVRAGQFRITLVEGVSIIGFILTAGFWTFEYCPYLPLLPFYS